MRVIDGGETFSWPASSPAVSGPWRRSVAIAASWLAGLVVAAVTFALVPGVVVAGEVAFGAGSLVGAVVSALLLVRTHEAAGRGTAGDGTVRT